MAAEVLASAGQRVTIYDRMPSPARKFLIAGRGGLNLTHSEKLDSFLTRYGTAQDWLEPSLRHFPPDALRAWCEGLGQETFIGSSGRVFPTRMKATELLRAWMARLEMLGVQYRPRHRWLGWEKDTLCFENATGEQVTVRTDATLLALGGASWPRLGSDGGWVEILKEAGVAVSPLLPANCGFRVNWSDYFRERFAGEPLKPVSLRHGQVSRQGEAMITAQGIEGGVFYALSAPIRDSLLREGSASIALDVRPDMTLEALTQRLSSGRGRKSFSSYMKGAGFSPLILHLLREAITAEELALASPTQLAAWLKALPLTLTGTTGMERAISSAGGIQREAMDENFMLLTRPGTFAAGEMLDWEAPTGGYLLQACFSTAVTAAKGILRYLSKDN
jgi:uncharacterized flavoprotein (TIGR03862 family)